MPKKKRKRKWSDWEKFTLFGLNIVMHYGHNREGVNFIIKRMQPIFRSMNTTMREKRVNDVIAKFYYKKL